MSISRRDFLARLSAIGAVWVAAATACYKESPPDAETHGPLPDQPAPPQQLVHFTPDEAAEIEAIAARIIPTDDTPGAKEAGVVFFIDRSLTTFAADQQKLFAEGLKQLAKEVSREHEGQTKLSMLAPEAQVEILRGIEKSEFFGAMRFATISGMFALPKYGGNRDYIGWKLVGRDPGAHFDPPFGWYDRPENQQALVGRLL
jgi:gluconate 2-dehydrogenase gamma chain